VNLLAQRCDWQPRRARGGCGRLRHRNSVAGLDRGHDHGGAWCQRCLVDRATRSCRATSAAAVHSIQEPHSSSGLAITTT
jgi:hypothetical protein